MKTNVKNVRSVLLGIAAAAGLLVAPGTATPALADDDGAHVCFAARGDSSGFGDEDGYDENGFDFNGYNENGMDYQGYTYQVNVDRAERYVLALLTEDFFQTRGCRALVNFDGTTYRYYASCDRGLVNERALVMQICDNGPTEYDDAGNEIDRGTYAISEWDWGDQRCLSDPNADDSQATVVASCKIR